MRVMCKEVWVKFRDNSNGQHITLGDGPTFCHRLSVLDDGIRLMISFLDKDNVARKVIAWPCDVVKEYTLETIESPAPSQPNPPKSTGG